jgi:hypothetical protein
MKVSPPIGVTETGKVIQVAYGKQRRHTVGEKSPFEIVSIGLFSSSRVMKPDRMNRDKAKFRD